MSAGEDRRDGARKALAALRQVPEMLLQENDSTAEWFARRDAAIAAILAAAGPLPPRAEGALRLLAEFHVTNEQDVSRDPDECEPEATMTAERLQQTRDEFATYIEQCQAQERRREGNVFYLGAR